MILDQTVSIVLIGKNIKHFERLGYKIPRYRDSRGRLSVKRGTKIEVNVNDLMPRCTQRIRCRCDFCHKERYIPYLKLIDPNIYNYTKTGQTLCVSCSSRSRNGSRNPAYRHGNRNYSRYCTGAKKRNLLFELTIEDFNKLSPGKCHYCGDDSAGIDRIDNTIGYIIDNCVPCCKSCNLMKRDYSYNEFLHKIQKISYHLKICVPNTET